MRKSKIILSLLIISLLTSKTWAVKAATSGTDENEINTKISTQADEQAGETDTTERSLVFTPTPSSTKLNEGEEITITLELSDIKMGQDGINTFGGKLEYDENVFEKVTSDDISSQNNWSIAYNDEETAKKGTFLATINTGTSKNQVIGIIKLKVKTNLKSQDTEIKFTSLSSVAEDTVKLDDQTLKFSVTGTVVPDDDKKDDDKGGNGNDSKLDKLLKELQDLKAEREEEKKAKTILDKRNQLKSALKGKEVKNEDWINDQLELIHIDSETDVDALTERLVKSYNRFNANTPPDITPGGVGSGTEKTDDYADVVAIVKKQSHRDEKQ